MSWMKSGEPASAQREIPFPRILERGSQVALYFENQADRYTFVQWAKSREINGMWPCFGDWVDSRP